MFWLLILPCTPPDSGYRRNVVHVTDPLDYQSDDTITRSKDVS